MTPSQTVSRFGGFFPTTHWTTLLQPINQRSPQAHDALERLFDIYRLPIVGLVRTMVRSHESAEDVAHAFIARMLERDDLANTDRNKGRFRCYLSTSIKNFVVSYHLAEDAKKRRPLNSAVPVDDLKVEPSHLLDAEREFTRQWWRATIAEAIRRIRNEWVAAGHETLFDDLEPRLWTGEDASSVKDIARKHGVTPGSLSLRIFRLKAMFRAVLITIIEETVGSRAEAEAEIRDFFHDQ